MDECLACALNEVSKGTHASKIYQIWVFLEGHSHECPFTALGLVITQTGLTKKHIKVTSTSQWYGRPKLKVFCRVPIGANKNNYGISNRDFGVIYDRIINKYL